MNKHKQSPTISTFAIFFFVLQHLPNATASRIRGRRPASMLFSTSLASWTRNLATRQTQFSSATALPNNFGTSSYIPLEMSDSPVMSRNYTKNISVIHLVKLMLTSRAINLRQIAPTLRIDLRLHFRLAHRPLQHQKVWVQGVSHTQETWSVSSVWQGDGGYQRGERVWQVVTGDPGEEQPHYSQPVKRFSGFQSKKDVCKRGLLFNSRDLTVGSLDDADETLNQQNTGPVSKRRIEFYFHLLLVSSWFLLDAGRWPAGLLANFFFLRSGSTT